MARPLNILAFAILAWATCYDSARAATFVIPNGSFESPSTTFISVNIDSWQKNSKPTNYDESGGFLWTQLTGAFKNTPPTSSDHLDNCDGGQAIWMFAVPEVALFQDYNSVDWNDAVPTHAFDAKFEVGKSYALTVGINGGGGGMSNGATMRISLYYRDDASNIVTVAATVVSNTPSNFPSHTHLTDFQAAVPVVRSGDAWAGRQIGMELRSTVTTNDQGGYWDIDNVRLSSMQEPTLTGTTWNQGLFQFTLVSEPGSVFEILAATNVDMPVSDWKHLCTLTNLTGRTSFFDGTALERRYYRARQSP